MAELSENIKSAVKVECESVWWMWVHLDMQNRELLNAMSVVIMGRIYIYLFGVDHDGYIY